MTAIWHYAIPPTVPLYWRPASATPAADFAVISRTDGEASPGPVIMLSRSLVNDEQA